MSGLDDAVRAVRAGRLVVLPTDTVYGIGTRADDPEATARLFAAKGRLSDAELPVFAPTTGAALRLAVFDDRAELLARAFWPGALTMVLPRTEESRDWALGGNSDTIGLRIPGHRLARAVTLGTGPLAISSANRSGSPVGTTCDELVAVFGDLVDVYLCEDEPLPSLASTVVDLTRPELAILRAGSVTEADLARALA
ncbi:MAG: L-threonylcarbamoyladenylate synthase [Actinomycetota bacterium]